MNSGYSYDLRLKVIEFVKAGNSQAKAARTFKICGKSIYTWLKMVENGESLKKKTKKRPSNPCKIQDLNKLQSIISENPHRTCAEIAIEWNKSAEIKVSKDTVRRSLKKLDFTYKRSSIQYRQADKKKQKEFTEKINEMPQENIFFIDEMGVDNSESPIYGWSKKGERLVYQKRAYATEKYNIIGALNGNKIADSMQFSGTCNKDIFATYMLNLIEKSPINSVFVLDNASFHKITELIEIKEALSKKKAVLCSYPLIHQN